MKSLKEPHMEDINAAVLACMEKLHELKVIDSNDLKHDVLFTDLSEILEQYFNYPDYANYN